MFFFWGGDVFFVIIPGAAGEEEEDEESRREKTHFFSPGKKKTKKNENFHFTTFQVTGACIYVDNGLNAMGLAVDSQSLARDEPAPAAAKETAKVAA